MIMPLPSTSTLPRISSGLCPQSEMNPPAWHTRLQGSNLPGYPSKVGRIALIAQMNPSADSRPTGTPRRTGTTRTSASPPVIPRCDEVEPRRRGQGLGLALQTWIVDGVLGQHLVEDGQEARVALERFGRWRDRRRGPYGQALLGGVGVKIRENMRIWVLRMRKHFLQLFSMNTSLLTLTFGKLTMLGLEASVETPLAALDIRKAGLRRENNMLLKSIGQWGHVAKFYVELPEQHAEFRLLQSMIRQPKFSARATGLSFAIQPWFVC